MTVYLPGSWDFRIRSTERSVADIADANQARFTGADAFQFNLLWTACQV